MKCDDGSSRLRSVSETYAVYPSGKSPKTPKRMKNGAMYAYGENFVSMRRRRRALLLLLARVSGAAVAPSLTLPLSPRRCSRCGRAAAAARPPFSCSASGDGLHVLQELRPRLRGRLLSLLDTLARIRRGCLDVALVRTEALRPQPQGGPGEDLSDGRAAEERVLEAGHCRARQQPGLARQVAGLLEDERLRRGRREEPDQIRRLCLVLRLLGDGEERPAPVAAGPRDVGDVPLPLRARRLALDVAHHPGGAGDRREAALLVARVPVVAERRKARGLAGRDPRHRQVPRRLDLRVRGRDDLSAPVVVGRVRLADHRVVDVAPGVEELHALRRVGLEPLPGGDERLPRGPQPRHRSAARRQAGLLEDVAPVADREAADVGAESQNRAVVRDALLPLPGQPPALQLRRAVLAEVDELLRLRGELGDEADLDRLDVGCPGVRRNVLREIRVVNGVVLD